MLLHLGVGVSPGAPTLRFVGGATFGGFGEPFLDLVQVIWEPGAVSIPASLEAAWNCIFVFFLMGNFKTRSPRSRMSLHVVVTFNMYAGCLCHAIARIS